MNTAYLDDFEKMNRTTKNVFDLGELGLLVILKDGTNLTSWWDIDDYDEVSYISVDFSRQKTPVRCRWCKNAKVVIVQNYNGPSQFGKSTLNRTFYDMQSLKAFYAIDWDTSGEKDMDDMFAQCYCLEYIYGLESWDTSGVENFWGTFSECCSLKKLDGLECWDLSSAVNMESMFDSCFALEDISALSAWDMSHLENIFEMFRACYTLEDASCLDWQFENLKNGDDIFIDCPNLKKLPQWYDKEFIYRFGIRKELEEMDDKAIYEKIKNDEFNQQDLFVAISYIEDKNMLRDLIEDSHLHFNAKRAVLLNPNFKDTEILEDYALNSYEHMERAYALENPNFTNVRLLKRIAKNDERYFVRFKAEIKLKKMLYEKFAKIDDN